MNSHCDCKIGVNCWLLLYNHTVLMHITVSIHCTATGQKHSTQLIQHCHEKKRWKDQPFMSYHQPQYLRYEIAYNWVREQLVVFQLAKWIQRRSMSQQSLQCSQKNKGLVTCCHTHTHTHTLLDGADEMRYNSQMQWPGLMACHWQLLYGWILLCASLHAVLIIALSRLSESVYGDAAARVSYLGAQTE